MVVNINSNKKSVDFRNYIGKTVNTRGGNKVKIICETRGKLYCYFMSNAGEYMNKYVKYNYDGSRWSNTSKSPEDLII